MSKHAKIKKKSEQVLAHINKEVGIDFVKYQELELKEFGKKINNIVMIQNYAVKMMIKPLLISLFIYLSIFFFVDMSLVGKIVYGIIGLLLFILNGVAYGALSFLSNLKKDIKLIINTSLDFTTNIFQDFNEINTNIKNIQNPMGLILEGLIAAIVTPTLSTTFTKVPIAGSFLMFSSDKAMGIVVTQFKNYENTTNVKSFIGNQSDKLINYSDKAQSLINTFSIKTDKYINNSFSTVQIPVRIMFTISIILTSVFVLSFIIF